jgi:segregation and condensation protein A
LRTPTTGSDARRPEPPVFTRSATQEQGTAPDLIKPPPAAQPTCGLRKSPTTPPAQTEAATQDEKAGLVDQYLRYISDAQVMRLEVAADYLVMAAWLTFLKSRLLIPRDKISDDEPSGEELAQRLSLRLMRLDAMRSMAAQLLTRHRLGRDVFACGTTEGVKTVRETQYAVGIYDLLHAYATQRVHGIRHVHHIKIRNVWSIKDARRLLERLIGKSTSEWVQLDLFMHQYLPINKNTNTGKSGEEQRSILAASFGASLEMAREGMINLRQDAPYAPLYMKRRTPQDVEG